MITRTLSTPQSDVGFLTWKGPQAGRQTEIGEFLTLGRDPGNHIVLEDQYISGRHARIERRSTGGGFVLRDLRSRNGTYLNGARVVEALLNDGDRLRLGGVDLEFSWQRKDGDREFLLSSRNVHWKSQLDRLPSIAQSLFPVLLTGPSGTGKDVLAQTIHRQSNRCNGPFVSVNCSALSEALVESELFGHVRGSFTGATGDRKGAFEAARGGTLFLDEIGDLPAVLQPKLLRALENNQIRPVGSDKPVDTDVRIIAATHQNLKRLVHEERFRADLYFRLHVVQLEAPALKDRREDFEDLFYYFARKMRVRFSFEAVQALKKHSFPGNIRELRNVVARAKAYCGDREVMAADVPPLVDLMPASVDPEGPEEGFRPSRSVIREIELEMIKSRLIANHGNQRRAAADLGMAKSTLHDRIRKYGIDVEKLLRGMKGG